MLHFVSKSAIAKLRFMNVAGLLSTLQKLNQHNENKECPMEVARVDGYTVPLEGPLASPELNYILSFRPPQEPAALERQNLTTLKQKWEDGRVQRIRRKEKLKLDYLQTRRTRETRRCHVEHDGCISGG